jgi:hypothetical protein
MAGYAAATGSWESSCNNYLPEELVCSIACGGPQLEPSPTRRSSIVPSRLQVSNQAGLVSRLEGTYLRHQLLTSWFPPGRECQLGHKLTDKLTAYVSCHHQVMISRLPGAATTHSRFPHHLPRSGLGFLNLLLAEVRTTPSRFITLSETPGLGPPITARTPGRAKAGCLEFPG